jgi:outer membrane protein OmpA-like peptidoglycan-associated protein
MAAETQSKACWWPLLLGLLALAILGAWGVYGGPHSAGKLKANTQALGAAALTAGGFSFANVEIKDAVAVVTGTAPDEAAKAAAFAAASAALVKTQGLPGVITRIDNQIQVLGALAEPAPAEPAVAAMPAAPAADDCQEAFKRTIEGRSINFVTARAEIAADSHPLLDELAAVAQRCQAFVTTVEGHTDPRGSAEYNKDLSQRRAQAVVDYLVGKGVARESLVAMGYGEERLIDTSDTPEGLARNRRTEFTVAARAAAQ